MRTPVPARFLLFWFCAAGPRAVVAMLWDGVAWRWFAAFFAVLVLIGLIDMAARRHTLRRNFPITAHIRTFFEFFRPMLRQYVVESDYEEVPFSHMQRSIVYQRSKNVEDKRPFGTELDVYADHYEWINHSMAPAKIDSHDFRITIGGPQCTQPYSASVFNISAMSFGSLSANAIRALNAGAKLGNFYHDTGEGSLSRYHREMGGDICWELGSGYFGCRNTDGTFSEERFIENATAAAGEDDRDQAVAGRQARPRRRVARREGDAGNRRSARRSGRCGLHFAGAAFGVFDAARACSNSCSACAKNPAASRPGSSSRSVIRGNGSASPRR